MKILGWVTFGVCGLNLVLGIIDMHTNLEFASNIAVYARYIGLILMLAYGCIGIFVYIRQRKNK